MVSARDVDRLEDQAAVELFVKGDEIAGVGLLHVKGVRRLVDPAFDKDQPVGIVGAGEEVIGDAARLGARGALRAGRPREDFRAGRDKRGLRCPT